MASGLAFGDETGIVKCRIGLDSLLKIRHICPGPFLAN